MRAASSTNHTPRFRVWCRVSHWRHAARVAGATAFSGSAPAIYFGGCAVGVASGLVHSLAHSSISATVCSTDSRAA